MHTFPSRPGVTLVELLLFLAIAAIMGTALMPLLFSSTENRLLQESISHIENNGSQIMQVIGKNVRESEIILDPPPGIEDTVLALQVASGALSPTIFGSLTGAIIQIQKTFTQQISASEVSVQDFKVRNISNGNSSGVIVSFSLSRTLRLSAPRTYTQRFESAFTLFPKTILIGNSCGYGLPGCTGVGTNRYAWQVCAPLPQNAQTQLDC